MGKQNIVLNPFFPWMCNCHSSCPQECDSVHDRGVNRGAHGEVSEQHSEGQHRADAQRIQPGARVSAQRDHL